jgi:DNA-binding SARP family transcriptional activator
MATPELILELFGGFRLRRNDNILCEFDPQQSGMLLAYLALHANRAATREEVIAWLLPDLEIEEGRYRLRQYLYTLRREIITCAVPDEQVLQINRNRLGLNTEAVRTDVADFEALLRAASACADVAERIRLLTAATALYRGELLPGFYDDRIEAERRRLTDLHYNALLALAAAHRSAGDLPEALEVAQRLIALDPLHEEAYCEAMRIYAESGRLSAAQRIYQRLADTLRQELDIEPSEEAQRLRQTLRLATNGDEGEKPSPRPASPPTVTVPAEAPALPVPEATASVVPPAAAIMSQAPHVSSSPVISPRRVPVRARLCLTVLLLVLLSAGLVWRPRTPHPHVAALPAATADATSGALRGVYGREAWVRPMAELPGDGGSEPTAMTIDDLGDLYITGFVHTAKQDVDYVTLKYDGNGTQIWQSRYNGPANDCDRARSLAVDAAHNVYVTGDSYNGDWDKGGTDYDVVTIKYDASGKPSATWPDVGFGVGVRRYDGAHRADWGKKVALDGVGDVYVGVTSERTTPRGARCSDFVILKYDANGRLAWSYRYNSTGNGVDDLTDLAVDAAGNCTVTGAGRGWGHSVMVTLQVDAAGHRRWIQTFDGPGDGEDIGLYLALDPHGNVYVAGYADLGSSQLGGSGPRMVTLKYSVAGTIKWYATDPGNSKPGALAVDKAGDVVVVGEGYTARGKGVRVLVYDTHGLPRRSTYTYSRVSSTAPGSNMAHGVTVDRNGRILVTGTVQNGPGAGDDYATLTCWLKDGPDKLLLYDGPQHGTDSGTAITYDGMGNIYVTGHAEGRSHGSITTLKYLP